MAYKTGTATGHEDLLEQFRLWIAGYGTNASAVADPGNVGGGSLGSITTKPATVTETITAVCTDDTVPATFTISGSVSGVFGTTATAGVAYLNSKVGFTITASGTAFAIDDAFTIAMTVGAMTAAGQAWIENTPTVATTTKISVPYTRSGSTYTATIPNHDLAAGETIGVAYITTGVDLNADYNVSAVATTTVSFVGSSTYSGGTMPTSGYMTVTLKETHLYLKGIGNGGTDEIFVQLRSYKNTGAGYYNVELRGATGFDAAITAPILNPGISSLVDLALSGGAMDYWFIANGRRFVIIAKIGTYYDSAYAGFILPTGLPSEWVYPLCVGGSSTTKKITNGTAGAARSAFFDPQSANCFLYEKNGNWLSFDNTASYSATSSKVHPNPYSLGFASNTHTPPLMPNLYSGTIDPVNSTYQLFPFSLMSRRTSPVTKDIFGDLQGVYKVSGHGNAASNIITADGFDHVVIPNVWRATKHDYAAFRLE